MLVSEKQHTDRSSQLPIEDVFTEHDINPNLAYNKITGYNFDFPTKWATADSSNKVIGLRKLDIIPSAHSFNLALRVYETIPTIPAEDQWTGFVEVKVKDYEVRPPFFEEGIHIMYPYYVNDDPSQKTQGFEHKVITGNNLSNIGHTTTVNAVKLSQDSYTHTIENGQYRVTHHRRTTNENVEAKWKQTIFKCFSVLEENGLIEIMHLIVQEFCEFMSMHLYKFVYVYKSEIGSIEFGVLNPDLVAQHFEFKFVTPEDAADFLRLLNQSVNYRNMEVLTHHLEDQYFHSDVWDRKHLHFHSTFSDTKRGYLGKNKDDLAHANKLFKYSHGNTSFNIHFTTDGLNHILPRFCHFVIELVFILNYMNNIIT